MTDDLSEYGPQDPKVISVSELSDLIEQMEERESGPPQGWVFPPALSGSDPHGSSHV